jgi:hypothetical protein
MEYGIWNVDNIDRGSEALGPLYHTTLAQMSWRKANVSAWVVVALPVASLSACWDVISTGGACVAK